MCQGGCWLGENNSIKMYIHIYLYRPECCDISYFGWSSLGFMFGSSLPFPAGLSCISFSSTISSVISTFPCKTFKHIHNQKKTDTKNCVYARKKSLHPAHVFHPAHSRMATSHEQPSGRRVSWAVAFSRKMSLAFQAASLSCTSLDS